MSYLDNVLANLWEKMAKSKHSHDICPKIAEMMVRRARRGFPQDTHFKVVMDTNIWMLGEDLFTSLQTTSLGEKWVGPLGGWLLVRAQRYLEREGHRTQVQYFAPIRSLILNEGRLSVCSFPGTSTEFFYRRRKGALFGLDIWEGVAPSHLLFSKGKNLQSHLLSLGNNRPKSFKDLPEFERLWFAYEGYNRINVNFKDLFREKLWRIYQERYDDQYNRLVAALANEGKAKANEEKAKKQTQDAWHLRMLELKEFGIDYFLTLDTLLIRKIRAKRKDRVFDKVKDKVVTPKEFCEKYGVGPVPIRYLAFNEASYPVDLDVQVRVPRGKSLDT